MYIEWEYLCANILSKLFAMKFSTIWPENSTHGWAHWAPNTHTKCIIDNDNLRTHNQANKIVHHTVKSNILQQTLNLSNLLWHKIDL